MTEFIPFLHECKGPPVLLFGASHVLHLKSHLASENVEDKYKLVFSNAEFVGVGGSTWGKIVKHVQGEKLTQFQKYLGHQWTPYKASSHKAMFTLLLLGSNDVDQFQDKLDSIAHGPGKNRVYWLEGKAELNAAYARITSQIDSVIDWLDNELEATTFLYSKILPGDWWSPLARTLARWLDMYVLRELRRSWGLFVREVWAWEVFETRFHLMECVMPGMINTDCVHLNCHGNKGLIYAIMRPLLHMWRAKCRLNGSWKR